MSQPSKRYKIIHPEDWERQHLYDFFIGCDDPFFSLTFDADITSLHTWAKSHQQSLFLSYLYCTIHAANQVKAFRYRIKDNQVIEFDEIFAGSTILLDDETFSFCYFDNHDRIEDFISHGRIKIQDLKTSKRFDPKFDHLEYVHCSPIPWVQFTGVKHARKMASGDSIPKFMFGKIYQRDQRWYLPIAVDVHHSLMDAYHVGMFVQALEAELHHQKFK